MTLTTMMLNRITPDSLEELLVPKKQNFPGKELFDDNV